MENEEKELTDGLTEIKHGLFQLTIMLYQYLEALGGKENARNASIEYLNLLINGIELTKEESKEENT